MNKVESITLFVNDRHLAKLTAETSPNLSLQSGHLEFLIDKIDSFGNFDFYESYPNKQYRIGLLEAKVTLEIKIDIDVESREFKIKGRAIDAKFLSDFEHYNSKMSICKLSSTLVDSINNNRSSFYYNIDAEVEFSEMDWTHEQFEFQRHIEAKRSCQTCKGE